MQAITTLDMVADANMGTFAKVCRRPRVSSNHPTTPRMTCIFRGPSIEGDYGDLNRSIVQQTDTEVPMVDLVCVALRHGHASPVRLVTEFPWSILRQAENGGDGMCKTHR